MTIDTSLIQERKRERDSGVSEEGEEKGEEEEEEEVMIACFLIFMMICYFCTTGIQKSLFNFFYFVESLMCPK